MASSNKKPKAPTGVTHEGARVRIPNALAQLKRSVLACLLFEDSFYESGEEIAERISRMAAHVPLSQVSDLAIEARTTHKLRHAPLWLTRAMLEHPERSGNSALISDTISHVINRADEMGELVAMYWKGGKHPLANALKVGLRNAFGKFDQYKLAKYMNRGAVRIRDVMFLVHPKPANAEREALYKAIADQTLAAPDTWEVALSGGADKRETFTRLINEGNLGALATLRNLRNMQSAGVERDTVRKALAREMKGVLPFQFVSAAKAVPMWEDMVEESMLNALAAMPRLRGKTVLLVDTSGSMDSRVSNKSDLMRGEAAAALAMLTREVCEEVEIAAFDDEVRPMPPRRGFGLISLLHPRNRGTNAHKAVQWANGRGYDRIIIVTDEQSRTELSMPLRDSTAYIMNVAAYQNGIGYGPWTTVSGFSESLIRFITETEARS